MRKLSSLALTAVVITTLSGCASGPSYKIKEGWVKKGMDQSDSTIQFRYCKEKASKVAKRKTQIGSLIENCMTLEGYSWGKYKVRI